MTRIAVIGLIGLGWSLGVLAGWATTTTHTVVCRAAPIVTGAGMGQRETATIMPFERVISRADLVGIYRGGTCTLVLDAAGSYSRCGHWGTYSVHGDDIFLRARGGYKMWLTVGASGELLTQGGDTYAVTSGGQP